MEGGENNVKNWEKYIKNIQKKKRKNTAEQRRKERIFKILEKFWEYWDLSGFYGPSMEIIGLKWSLGKAAPKDKIPVLEGFSGIGKGLGKAETEEQMDMDKLLRNI